MKFKQMIAATSIAVMGLAGAALPAQAATHYKRTATTKVSHKAYYSTSKTGKTYQFVGSTKKFRFKANHALKNYTKTTWTRSSKTTVKKAGKAVTYYYVTSANKRAKGWVAASYLKAGKNYQATTATKTKSTPYYQVKTDQLVKISGANANVKLTKGTALKSHLTYNKTQQRNLYIKGKKVRYDYVKSADGKAKGWVHASVLKAGKDHQMTTAKTISAKALIRAKAGKAFALTGTNQVARFSHGQTLTASDNYTATQSRTVYLKGRKHTYYHVTNTNGSINGWVNAAYLKAGQHPTTTTNNVFDGRSENVLYIGDATTLYTNAQLTKTSAVTLKPETAVTAYPDGITELRTGVYAVPVKVNGQKLYLKGQFQELPDNQLLPAGFYYSLSDTSFYGDVQPTDAAVKISAPFLTGTTWKYYYAGGHTVYQYNGQTWQTTTTN
ncbi:hypothetical protein [Lactiplantibacillus carotarum]|uniref:hypothetical protein n=1 Tax=Lactiplantibacillus carotarum TaxID=2993456 RepID=UPI00298F388D|nr:hypothetical protein [Lactiplantibacillus carotarum]